MVLYSSYGVNNLTNWLEGQKYNASQSSKSELIEVPGGHYIYIENPDLVCNSIKKVLAAI